MRQYNTVEASSGASTWVEQFDTLGEVLTYAKANTNRKSSDSTDNNSWAGSNSLDEAIGLARTGWKAVLPEVNKAFDLIKESMALTVSSMFETEFSVTGDSVDIDRYLRGEPECMVEFVDIPQARMGRIVKLLVSGSTNSGTDPEKIIRRGITILGLLDTLSKIGVGVEIYLENTTYDVNCKDQRTKDCAYHSMLVMIHSSEMKFDIENIMFAIAHPSMLRRISFSNMELTKWKPKAKLVQRGYGRSVPVRLGELLGADVICDHVPDNVDDGNKWIMDTIRGLDLLGGV